MIILIAILVAILGGLLGAGLGCVAGFLIGSALAGTFGMSGFEGASGYFALSIAIVMGFAGLIAGMVLALRLTGVRGFAATAGRTAAALAIIGAITAAGIMIRLATVEHFSDGNPTLEFEIRLPAGMPAPDRKTVDFEMQAGSQRSGGLLNTEWARRDGERVVLSGLVQLYTRTSSRILIATLPDQPRLLFQIGLSGTPKVSEDFGKWQRVSFLDDMKADSQPRKPGAAETFEIRYKVPDRENP
jgi:hypothetical protein